MMTSEYDWLCKTRICSKQPLRKNMAEANHSASQIMRVLNASENQAASVPKQAGAANLSESSWQSVVLPAPLAPSRATTRMGGISGPEPWQSQRIEGEAVTLLIAVNLHAAVPEHGGAEDVHGVARKRRRVNVFLAGNSPVAVDVAGVFERGGCVFEQLAQLVVAQIIKLNVAIKTAITKAFRSLWIGDTNAETGRSV